MKMCVCAQTRSLFILSSERVDFVLFCFIVVVVVVVLGLFVCFLLFCFVFCFLLFFFFLGGGGGGWAESEPMFTSREKSPLPGKRILL